MIMLPHPGEPMNLLPHPGEPMILLIFRKAEFPENTRIYLILERGMLERQMIVPLPSDQSVQQPSYAGNSKKPA